VSHICSFTFFPSNSIVRILKSMPMVVMNEGVKESSLNRRRQHDLPTPESPISNSLICFFWSACKSGTAVEVSYVPGSHNYAYQPSRIWSRRGGKGGSLLRELDYAMERWKLWGRVRVGVVDSLGFAVWMTTLTILDGGLGKATVQRRTIQT